MSRTFPSGNLKRLYVDRERAAKSLPPNVVEVLDIDGTVQEKVCGSQVRGFGQFNMCWSGDTKRKPTVWVETRAWVEVLLAEDMPL